MSDHSHSREVYPNAPLKLVVCELRLQLAPGSATAAAELPFYEEIGDDYPLQGPPEQGIRVNLSPAGAVSTPVRGFRYLTRDKTRSVAVNSESLIVETSSYLHFEQFSNQIGDLLDALGRHLKVVSVERIGLRYIDELPIAGLPGQTPEAFFAASALACGSEIPGLGQPTEFLSTSSYRLGDDRVAVMRAGLVDQPFVSTNGPLRIPHPSTGPLFVIDADCSWSAVNTPSLPFERAMITTVLSDLHAPVRSLFEYTITEKLRNEVLRKEGTPA